MRLKMNMLVAAGILSIAGGVWADDAHHQRAVASEDTAVAASALTPGEVRKVDTAQGKVTLRHEAIANLDMPAMTMVFRADKPELLKDLKAGDKVRFRAESVGGALVVTQIQPAQ